MFIHIGERKIISDKNIVGIFNYETLVKSSLNGRYTEDLQCDIRTIVIDRYNHILCSKVSPYTVIKRTSLDENDCFWSRK